MRIVKTAPGATGAVPAQAGPLSPFGDLWPYWDPAGPPKVAGMPSTFTSTACRGGDHEECREQPVVLCTCICHDDERRESARIPIRPIHADDLR